MYRFLLVDDEKMALVSSLHSFPWDAHGFSPPITTNNPHEALALLRSESFDAVFVDIRMPEISGIDIIRLCRAEGIDVEFIVLSGYSDFEYARSALQLNALDYCLKPVLPEDASRVLSRLSHHLFEKRCAQDAVRAQRLSSIAPVNDLLRARRMPPAGKAILQAALRCPNLEDGLKRLPFHENELFWLVAADTLLYLSTDAIATPEQLAQRFLLDDACRLCYCITVAEDAEPGKQFSRLLAELSHTSAELPLVNIRPRESNSAFFQLLDYVDAHYTENLSLRALSEQYHLNYTYCSELFREMTHQTFTKYITGLRMSRARELIRRPEYSLTDIAAAVGYKNYHHFVTTFKNHFGQTPTAYRQNT